MTYQVTLRTDVLARASNTLRNVSYQAFWGRHQAHIFAFLVPT